MEWINLVSVWLIGLGLGAMHALDADHLLTLANVEPQQSTLKNRVAYCLRWAMGHGAAVMLLGSTVLVLQLAIPYGVSAIAEHLVGLILMLLGSIALYQSAHSIAMVRQSSVLTNPVPNEKSLSSRQQSRIVGIGFLHGTAGTAALLALIPLTQLATPWQGMSYLLFFSTGVLIAMLIFGSVFAGVIGFIGKRSIQSLSVIRVCIAAPAILIGLWMVLPQS